MAFSFFFPQNNVTALPASSQEPRKEPTPRCSVKKIPSPSVKKVSSPSLKTSPLPQLLRHSLGPKISRIRLRTLQLVSLLLCVAALSYARSHSYTPPGTWRARRLIGTVLDGNRAERSWSQQATCPTDHRLDKALAVCLALDHHWNVSSVADLEGYANENGAFSKHNQRYDETKTGRWYIEEQYYGFMFIQAGLAFDNSKAIDLGMRIFNWGFEQQLPNGSYSCPDAYHSSGFFMEAVARAALLLRFSPNGRKYEHWIKNAEKHLSRQVDWFLSPEVERVQWRLEARHTHRRYLTGTGLGLVAKLTGNKTLLDISWTYVESALSQQDPAGFNLERGGYDCSYQGIGLVYAARYFLYVASTQAHRAQLLEMGRRGTSWLEGRIYKDGSITTRGNTRTGLKQEKGRDGQPKALAKREIVQALLYWGWILGDEGAVDTAWLVEEERTGSLHRPCSCNLDADGMWQAKNVLRCEMGLCGKEIKVMSQSRASFAKRYGMKTT